jgi:choline dehydrogenase-like flavoprotein
VTTQSQPAVRIEDHIPAAPEAEEWDVVVLGAGMGGSTAGLEVARRGGRVLFIEKGKFLHGDPLKRQISPDVGEGEEAWAAEERLIMGRWPLPVRGWSSFGDVEFYAPLGCGSGGSTIIYGAQLERFAPSDFHPKEHFPDVPDASVVESWPITYDELVPYYRRAEALFNISGTPDPLNPDPEAVLRTPPPLGERDQHLFDTFSESGLHPYRSHVGYHKLDNCDECLDLCLRNCKSDAGRDCLVPALREHGASMLPESEVLRFEASRSRVESVRIVRKGVESSIRAKVFVLGAGSWGSPVLLLRSNSSEWPDGLANSSGLVGRNLMLHTSDFMTIDQRELRSEAGPRKSMALSDFYIDGKEKLGTLQSVGLPLIAPFIREYLRYALEKDPRWWCRFVEPRLETVARIGERLSRRASLLSTIVEDLPYPDNRVQVDPSAPNGRSFTYTYPAELARRSRRLLKLVRGRLGRRYPLRVVTGGRNNLNYGHVCGTCRFGDDPATSVLDRTNRAHDLDNLYLVDSSFFPSSGGINPSLTIAANALRVGGIIHERL